MATGKEIDANKVLEEIEAEIGKIRGLLSKRASLGGKVSPNEIGFVLALDGLAKQIRTLIESSQKP